MEEKSGWLNDESNALTTCARFCQELFGKISRTCLPELSALFLISSLYLMNSFRFIYPVGYAGFFALMSDLLSENHFSPPIEVPFYGPGGVPFAYPPLGMYLASGITALLKISTLDYLRWAPALMTILALIAMYSLTREILGNRFKAILATLLLSTVNIIYISHATSAGMVRSLALLLSFCLLKIVHKIFSDNQNNHGLTALAALLLGLIALTHLSYFLFTLLSLAALLLCSPRSRFWKNTAQIALIGAGSIILMLPWYGRVLLHYGTETLLYASASHGSFGIVHQASGDILAITKLLLSWFYNFGRTINPFFLAGTGLLGFVYAIIKKRWLLPVWLIVVALLLGETARYEAIVACMLTADLLGDMSHLGNTGLQQASKSRPFTILLTTGLITAVFFAQGLKQFRTRLPVLSHDVLNVTTWLKENAHPEGTYLLLSDSHDLSEWFPYLSRRTPAISYWGSEWNGRYEEQQGYFEALRSCLSEGSYSCINQLMNSIDVVPDYLVVPDAFKSFGEQIQTESDWEPVYDSNGFTVFSSEND